ncbi:MAG: hypothetical protein ABFD81_11920 [Syntrophaceae bacterium]
MKYAHTKVRTADSAHSPGWPRKFEVEGTMVDVLEVLDHWVSAAKDPSFYPNEYFKVRVSGGGVFILMYNTLFDSWWIKEHIT